MQKEFDSGTFLVEILYVVLGVVGAVVFLYVVFRVVGKYGNQMRERKGLDHDERDH